MIFSAASCLTSGNYRFGFATDGSEGVGMFANGDRLVGWIRSLFDIDSV